MRGIQHRRRASQLPAEHIMKTVVSADGTPIAYDRVGSGDPLILVGGTFSYRRFPAQVKLAELLAPRFTVYGYDRRGRGDSGDTAPYAVDREIEDLAALIDVAGGYAHVWGLSSGGILALQAAAAGLPIRRLAIQEPPWVVVPPARRPPADMRQRVSELIDAGQRGEAVRYVMVDGMGAPSFVPVLLHLMPGVWKRLTAVAHPLPAGQWAEVTVPAVVMCGTEKETPPGLRHAAAAVAAALPDGKLIERRGLGHSKKLTPNAIAAALTEFLTEPTRQSHR